MFSPAEAGDTQGRRRTRTRSAASGSFVSLKRRNQMPAVSHSPATPATRAYERELFERFQRDGDIAARAELVDRFLPLARKLARRYERASEPLDDLIQVASLGLVKAIDRFDCERGDAFSSYAVPTILGELKRHF